MRFESFGMEDGGYRTIANHSSGFSPLPERSGIFPFPIGDRKRQPEKNECQRRRGSSIFCC